MKQLNKCILAVSLIFSSGLAIANEPKDVLNAFHAALVSGDKAKVKQVLSPEVTIYEAGYAERSREEYESHHMDGDMKFAKTSTQTVLKHTEKKEGNMAVIWEETETKTKLNGIDVTILGTTTAFLEKNGDTWQITHVHWSSRKPK